MKCFIYNIECDLTDMEGHCTTSENHCPHAILEEDEEPNEKDWDQALKEKKENE